MKKLILLSTFLIFIGIPSFAQNALGKFSGKVSDESANTTLPGATVIATNESTGFQTGTVTDKNGQFVIDDLPLGGPYSVRISFVGYAEKVFRGYMLNMRDHIVIPDVVMTTESTALNEVTVTGFSYKSSRDRIGAATRIDSTMMNKIATATRNYQDLAQLSPLTRGTNISGARGNMRGLTLDGVSNRMHMFGTTSEGAFPVSMEAIREFEVVTNTYSVADGRGGAGTIKGVTKSGTNDFHATAWGYYTGGRLAGVEINKDGDEWKKGKKGENKNSQYGLNISGAVIKNKLHYFIGFDRYVQQQPWRTWDFDNAGANLADAENTLGITKQNMDILVTHMVNNMGVPDVQQYGTMNIERETNNVFARFDWTINAKHQLMARYNYHVYLQPDKMLSKGLFSTQYEGRQRDHTILLNLISRFNYKVKNDLKLSYGDFKRTGNNVYQRVPVGYVKVSSLLPNGQTKEVSVGFGNQYWAPETIASNDFQLVDNLTIVSGNMRMLFGTDIQYNRIHDLLTHYQQGEFVYYSLEHLLNNIPDEYNRKVPMTSDAGKPVNPKIFSFGLYGETTWNPNEKLEVTAGLRWDMTYLPTKPKSDPLLQSELGIKSDVSPLDINNFQPRFNLNWDITGKGSDLLKFGLGWFVSEFTSQALSFALINNAGNYKSVSARPANGNMPTANWPSYYQSFDNVPGYENWLVPNNIDVSSIPNSVHLIDEKLENPMTFKTHISYSKFLLNNLVVTTGFYFNRTANQYMLENKNIKDNPEFYIAEEGNRGVYVPSAQIANNGLADYNNARKSQRFNEALVFTNADWAATSWNAVIEAAYKIKDGEIRSSYTYGQSKGGVRYNSGNPKDMFYTTTSYNSYKDNAANWFDEDDMRHKLIFTLVSPSFKGFSASANIMFYQWDHFHSTVNRDQNGDDTPYSDNEDLSYIFDPATAPAAIREDLQYVYDNTSKPYLDFLNKYKGSYAEPNGGLNPWKQKFDLSLMKKITVAKKNHIEIRVDFFNLLNLLNYKWGGSHYVSNTRLYQITAFDKNTNTYTYKVDKDAGKLRYRIGSDELYRIQLGLKYSF